MKFNWIIVNLMLIIGVFVANSEQIVLQQGVDGYAGCMGICLFNEEWGDGKPYGQMEGWATFKEGAKYFTLTDAAC